MVSLRFSRCSRNTVSEKTPAAIYDANLVGDPFSAIFPRRVVHKDLLDQGFSGLMRDWLRRCSNTHSKCPPQVESNMPTRVIDVGAMYTQPRLLHSNHRQGKWVALSHCWGGHPPLRTEKASLESHCEDLPLDILPPSFRDAILITRNLGFEYLWIDSLCIIQDSKEDWLKESVDMGRIFKDAIVTINADAAEDSSRGIIAPSSQLRNSRRLKIPKTRCHSASRNLQGRIFFDDNFSSNDDLTTYVRGPLGRRGWTLQEEILPPRVLHFTDSLLIWRCVQQLALETRPNLSGFIKNRFGPTRSFLVSDAFRKNEDADTRPLSRYSLGRAILVPWTPILPISMLKSELKIWQDCNRMFSATGTVKLWTGIAGERCPTQVTKYVFPTLSRGLFSSFEPLCTTRSQREE
jgi:hypothetical protein